MALILENNERFRQALEHNIGPNGVTGNVLGLRPPAYFQENPVETEITERMLDKTIIPEEWSKRREFSEAANTISINWSITPWE